MVDEKEKTGWTPPSNAKAVGGQEWAPPPNARVSEPLDVDTRNKYKEKFGVDPTKTGRTDAEIKKRLEDAVSMPIPPSPDIDMDELMGTQAHRETLGVQLQEANKKYDKILNDYYDGYVGYQNSEIAKKAKADEEAKKKEFTDFAFSHIQNEPVFPGKERGDILRAELEPMLREKTGEEDVSQYYELALDQLKRKFVAQKTEAILPDYSEFYSTRSKEVEDKNQKLEQAFQVMQKEVGSVGPMMPTRAPGMEFIGEGQIIDEFLSREDFQGLSKDERQMLRTSLTGERKMAAMVDKAVERVNARYENDVTASEGTVTAAKDLKKRADEIVRTGTKEIQAIDMAYNNAAVDAQARYNRTVEKYQDEITKGDEFNTKLEELKARVNKGEISSEDATAELNNFANLLIKNHPDVKKIEQEFSILTNDYHKRWNKAKKGIDQSIEVESQAFEDRYRNEILGEVKAMAAEEEAALTANWEKLSWYQKMARGWTNGYGQIDKGLGGAINYLTGGSQLGNELTDAGNQIEFDNKLIDVGEFTTEKLLDSDWWATRAVPSMPLTVSLMLPGMGLYGTTSKVAAGIGMRGLLNTVVSGAVAGTGQRSLESVIEAGIRVEDLLSKGHSVEYASDQGAQIYADNMGLLITDATQLMLLFSPVKNNWMKSFGKFMAQPILEGAEELYQEALPLRQERERRFMEGEAQPMNDPAANFTSNPITNAIEFFDSPMGKEVFTIGAAMGLGFAGAGVASDVVESVDQRQMNRLVRKFVADAIEDGVVAMPGEAETEAIARRKWQLMTSLDEMLDRGDINTPMYNMAKNQLDKVWEMYGSTPNYLERDRRIQMTSVLEEAEGVRTQMEDSKSEAVKNVLNSRLKNLEKKVQEIHDGTAKGYFVDGVELSKDELMAYARNPKFVEDIKNSGKKVTIYNDEATQKELNEMLAQQQGEPGGGTIAVTPFAESRIPKYQELNNELEQARGSNDQERVNEIVGEMQNDLQYWVDNVLPEREYSIEPMRGVWQGGSEPVFRIKFDKVDNDVLTLASRLGEVFDQDAVHVVSNEFSDDDELMQMDETGGAVVPVAQIEFGNAITPEEFQELLTKYGLGGGSLHDSGESATIYMTDLSGDINTFEALIQNIGNDESIGGTKNIEEGFQRLWQFEREGEGTNSRTYEWVKDNVVPSEKYSEELRDQPAKRVLSNSQATHVARVENLNIPIKGYATKAAKKLQQVGSYYDRMAMFDLDNPLVREGYEALTNVLEEQYKRIPIRVYPHAKAIMKNGNVEWETINSEPYESSRDVFNDIRDNNRMTFFVTDKKSFGSDSSKDYSSHPLLKASGFSTVPIPVVDENGKVVRDENGNVAKAAYDVTFNDLLRVVHDYYAHATTDASFGARGEERAWAAHVASILEEEGLSDREKLMGIWALTSETRGQNSWVNFVNEENKSVNSKLDEARRLKKEGKKRQASKVKARAGEITFADQKVGLMPADAMIGGHDETSVADNWIQDQLKKQGFSETEAPTPLNEQGDYAQKVEEKNLKSQIAKVKQDLLNDLFGDGTVGFAFDPEKEAEKMQRIHNNIVKLAKLYIQQGVETATDFANQVGLQISDIAQAWSEAKYNWKIDPKDIMYDVPKMRSFMGKTAKQKQVEVEAGMRTPNKVTIDEYTLLRDRIRTLARGVRMGRADMQQLKQALIDELNGTVSADDVVKYSRIRPVMNAIKNAKTEAGIDRAIDRIGILGQEVAATRTEQALNKILDYTDPKRFKKSTPTGLAKGKRVDNATRKMLSSINEMVKSNDDLMQKTRDMLDQAIADGRALNNEEQDLYRATLIAGRIQWALENSSYNAMGRLLETVKSLDKEGRANFKDAALERMNEYVEAQGIAVQDITGGRGVNTSFAKKADEDARKSWFGRVKDQVGDYSSRMQSWDFLMDQLSKGRKQDVMQGVMNRLASDPMNQADRDYKKGMQEQMSSFQSKLLEIYGSPKTVEANLVRNTIPEEIGTFVDINGEEQTISLSQNEAYYLYNLMQDPSLDATWTKMGWTDEMKNAIVSSLTPEVKAWADWQRQEFYPEYYDGVNRTYNDLYQIDLPRNEHYTPLRRENMARQEEDILSFKNNVASVVNGSLKERVANTRAVAIKDGDSMLYQHVTKMEYFKSHAVPLKKISAIFNSDPVRKAVKQEHGDYMLRTLDNFITDFATQGLSSAESVSLFDTVRGNFITARLAANPVVLIKQLTSFPAYMAEMPVADFAKGLTFLGNPKEIGKAYDTLFSDPYIKDRYGSGFDRDMAIAMARNHVKQFAGKSNLATKLMVLTQIGDGGAILMGGWPYYKWMYSEMKKLGLPDDVAHDRAMDKFVEVTRRSQQATNTKDLNTFQRSGQFAKWFTMFKTSPIIYFQHEQAAIRALMRGNTEQKRKALKRFAIYHFVLPSIFQYVAAAFPGLATDWDEEDTASMIRANLLGSFNGLFIIGDLAWFAGDHFMGKPWANEFSPTPMFETFEQVIKASNKTIEEVTGEEADMKEIVDAMTDLGAASADLGGLPGSFTKRMYENYSYMSDAWNNLDASEKTLIALGWNPRIVMSSDEFKESTKTEGEKVISKSKEGKKEVTEAKKDQRKKYGESLPDKAVDPSEYTAPEEYEKWLDENYPEDKESEVEKMVVEHNKKYVDPKYLEILKASSVDSKTAAEVISTYFGKPSLKEWENIEDNMKLLGKEVSSDVKDEVAEMNK